MKYLIIFFISLSAILACHSSCNCNPGSNECKSCKYASIGSQIDSNQRSCPCPTGYVSSTQFITNQWEFECKKQINTDSQGNEIDAEMDACNLEIGLKTKEMKVLTSCHFETIDGKSYVISNVKLDYSRTNLNNFCLSSIISKLYFFYQDSEFEPIELFDFPKEYIIDNIGGSKLIKIPLIDIYNVANSQTTNNEQIVQVVKLKIDIGHEDTIVRSHKWDLIVYTNRDQVEVFQMDIDVQETEGCQPGQECIVIADLDTVSNVYTDSNFDNIQYPPHNYQVGDTFYAKIKFADPTYSKQLMLITLYFKSDQSQVFNFSSITYAYWDGNGLRVSFPLVQPSQQAVIQVNMRVSTLNARFLMYKKEEQIVQTQFTANIVENQLSNSAYQDITNRSHAKILLGIIIFSTLSLLF